MLKRLFLHDCRNISENAACDSFHSACPTGGSRSCRRKVCRRRSLFPTPPRILSLFRSCWPSGCSSLCSQLQPSSAQADVWTWTFLSYWQERREREGAGGWREAGLRGFAGFARFLFSFDAPDRCSVAVFVGFVASPSQRGASAPMAFVLPSQVSGVSGASRLAARGINGFSTKRSPSPQARIGRCIA